MRAFVAVEVPAPELPVPVPRPPERHLTLRFFAELGEDRVGEVVEAMRGSVAGVAPFPVELRGGGAFPDVERPRVVYLGVEEGAAPLREIATRLEEQLARRGLPGEGRPLVPHVTLFRVRGPRDTGRAHEVLAGLGERPLARFEVRELRLFSSRLSREGAEHTLVASVPITGAPGTSPPGAPG